MQPKSCAERVVLATGPGNPPAVCVFTGGLVQFGLLPSHKPNPRCLGGFFTRTGHKPAVFWPGCTRTASPFHHSSILPPNVAPIKYLSSDRIMTQSLCILCSFSCSFTSRCQICDQTNIRWVAVKLPDITRKIGVFFITTQRILVWSQIWQREVKAQLKLHNLRTDHVMIRSELKYFIGCQNVNMICSVFGGKTSPFPMVWVFRVVRPVATVRFGVEPSLQPAREFGPVATTKRESKAANEWPASTLLPVGSNPEVYLHQILSPGEQPRSVSWWILLFHDPMTRTVIYPRHWSCSPALRCAMLSWSGKRTKAFIQKLPSQSWQRTDLIARTTSMIRMTVVRTHPAALQQVPSCQPRLVL